MKEQYWRNLDHFRPVEFDSPDEPGTGLRMEEDLMIMLDAARRIAGVPFRIPAGGGYRTRAYNDELRTRNPLASPRSLHMEGRAADISISDNGDRARILGALITVGFERIGIARSFIHVDLGSDDRRSPSIWVY